MCNNTPKMIKCVNQVNLVFLLLTIIYTQFYLFKKKKEVKIVEVVFLNDFFFYFVALWCDKD